MDNEPILIYMSEWASKDKEAETIVECIPWVDNESENLILTLKKKTKTGQKVMSIALSKQQYEKIFEYLKFRELVD